MRTQVGVFERQIDTSTRTYPVWKVIQTVHALAERGNYAVEEADLNESCPLSETTLRGYRKQFKEKDMNKGESMFFKFSGAWYWTAAGLRLVASQMRIASKREFLKAVAEVIDGARQKDQLGEVAISPNSNLGKAAVAAGTSEAAAQEVVDSVNRAFDLKPELEVMASKTLTHSVKKQLFQSPLMMIRIDELAKRMSTGVDKEQALARLDHLIKEARPLMPPVSDFIKLIPVPETKETELFISPVGAQLLIGIAAQGLSHELTDEQRRDTILDLQMASLYCSLVMSKALTLAPDHFKLWIEEPATEDIPKPAATQPTGVLRRTDVVRDVVIYLRERNKVNKALNNVISDAVQDTVQEAQKMRRGGVVDAANWGTHERVNGAIKEHVGKGPRNCWDEPAEFRMGLECLQRIRVQLGIRTDSRVSLEIESAIRESLSAESMLLKLLEDPALPAT